MITDYHFLSFVESIAKIRKLNSPWHLRKANRSVGGRETIICIDQPISGGLSGQVLIEAMQEYYVVLKINAEFGLDKVTTRNAARISKRDRPQLPDEGTLGNARRGDCRGRKTEKSDHGLSLFLTRMSAGLARKPWWGFQLHKRTCRASGTRLSLARDVRITARNGTRFCA